MKKIKLGLAIGCLLAGVGLILTAGCGSVKVGKLAPQTNAEFGKTSVSITLENKRSGGSGVILRSTATESFVLTNKHVCNLIQNGGVVNNDQGTFPISSYKAYPRHDLCIVRVMTNLHVNTKLAENPPSEFDEMIISGHPALLPTLITKGHFAKHIIIDLMVDTVPCTGEETDEDTMYCTFLGMKPVIQSFDSQVTSGLIMPGSSGSGVFNSKGEVSGLVFAGPGQGLGFGFIVPYEYVADFLKNANQYNWVRPSKDTPKHSLFKELYTLENICGSLKNHCGVQNHGIYNH